jgi:hypothetical protein
LGSTSLAAGQSTTFTLRFAPGSGGSFSGSISLVNNDGNENPYNLNLQGTGTVPAPEITLLLGSTGLASGGTVNFGATTVGTAVTRTITIRNDGNASLTLTSVNPASLPAGFSIVTNLGATTLGAGQSTTLVLRLDAGAAGAFSGSFQLASSDGNENPYTINLSGSVQASVVTIREIIDNGDAGYSAKGGSNVLGKGFESDIRQTAKGNGSKYSTWTFTGLPSGEYNVWGTWTGGSKNATSAPFSLVTGSGAAKVVKMNQRVAANGLAADGAKWRFLGTINVTKGWAVVKLTNKAKGFVVADAIRLVQKTSPAPSASELLVHAGAPSHLGRDAVLAVLASSADDAQGHVDALPLPAEPADSHQATRDRVWSQPDDVAPEKAVLEETLGLLSVSRSAVGGDLGLLDELFAAGELL